MFVPVIVIIPPEEETRGDERLVVPCPTGLILHESIVKLPEYNVKQEAV
jgi:hypothetical protein